MENEGYYYPDTDESLYALLDSLGSGFFVGKEVVSPRDVCAAVYISQLHLFFPLA